MFLKLISIILSFLQPLHALLPEQTFILDSHQQKIEYYLMKPEGDGPFPALFLLHGHQMPPTSGGRQFIDMGWLDNYFASEQMVVVAISTPGFGGSEGTRDFSGPASRQAVAEVIRHVGEQSFVDRTRMGIYGISNGATLASMIHAYYPGLLFQILEAGWYDLTTCSALMPDYLEKIKETIVEQTGGSEQALKERSAVFNTAAVTADTLLLLGEFDDRRTLPSAIALHNQLLKEGKQSLLRIFPSELHTLSFEKWNIIFPYLRQQFFQSYGIGIRWVMVPPAIHVAKIIAGSPADLSGKFNVGDVVLSVSPNNDSQEIDVLRMPLPQFSSLLGGKKGSTLRLCIQHFDQTVEEIVLERGPIFN